MRALFSALLLAAVIVTSPARAERDALPAMLQPYAAALTEVPRALPRQGAIYVPAYSTLSAIAGLTKVNFAVTLSIRNPSATRTLVVRRIAFFNTIGEELQVYLTQPVGLRPFGTVNLFIPVQDQRGGAGGNFLVEWAAEAGCARPARRGDHAGRDGRLELQLRLSWTGDWRCAVAMSCASKRHSSAMDAGTHPR